MKGKDIVQKRVLQLIEHFTQELLQIEKIDGKALLVEPFRGHGDGHAPVVAVQLLAFALVAAQLMGRGEFRFDHQFIHSAG